MGCRFISYLFVCIYPLCYFIFRLLNYLRKLKPEELPEGGIDNISMSLMMAFLYVLDLSLLHKEDGEG